MDVLWAAWRQGKANQGAPGVDGMAIEGRMHPGDEEERSPTLHEALREQPSQCAPVRVVEIPQPPGGTRPRGLAPVEERVVQTAMPLGLEPICEADCPDGAYGDRPTRDAKPAAIAMRADRSHRAWGGVEMEFQAYCTRIPHRKLMTLSTRRIAAGSLRKLIKQTRTGGASVKGQVVPTKGGAARLPALPVVQQRFPHPCGATVAESRLSGAARCNPPPRRGCCPPSP